MPPVKNKTKATARDQPFIGPIKREHHQQQSMAYMHKAPTHTKGANGRPNQATPSNYKGAPSQKSTPKKPTYGHRRTNSILCLS